MSVIVDYNFGLKTVETFDPIDGTNQLRLNFNEYEFSGRLDADSTPAATKACYLGITPTGSGTLDLTMLTGPIGTTVDATGLKLLAIRIRNSGTGTFTLAVGGTNGYTIPNTIAVGAGCVAQAYFADTLTAITGTEKELDYSIASGDPEVELTFIFGS
jgi:hypothetical protein